MRALKNILVLTIVWLMIGVAIALTFEFPLTMMTFFLLMAIHYFLNPFDQETIKVKYFDRQIPPLEKIVKGDWIDLRSAETIELKAGQYHLIHLGIGMILPDGYEAHVLPRSSTPAKFGIILANSQGVIDNSYSGDMDEWRFPALAVRDTVINKGDRICQFRIVKNQPRLRIKTVKHLNSVSRGGIGSTGKR